MSRRTHPHGRLGTGDCAPSAGERQPGRVHRCGLTAIHGTNAPVALYPRHFARKEAAHARLDRARVFFAADLTLTATGTRRACEVTRTVGGPRVVVRSERALNRHATLTAVLFDARSIPPERAAAADREAASVDARLASRASTGRTALGEVPAPRRPRE